MSAQDSPTGRPTGHDPVAESVRLLGADHVPPVAGGAARARRTAGRRAVARTVGITAAVVTVLAVVPVAASLGGEQAAPVRPAASAPPSPVAEPSPTVSEVPSVAPPVIPAVTPSVTPSAEPSAAPTPPAPEVEPTTEEPTPPSTPAEPPVLVVPGDWREPRTAGTLDGFVPTAHRQYTDGSVGGAGASWQTSACGAVEGGSGYAADRWRTGFYSAVGSLGEGWSSWQAATYVDEARAAQAMAEIAAVVECPGSAELAPRTWSVRSQSDDLVVLTWRAVGAGSGLGAPENAEGYPVQDGGYVAVRRDGDVIALAELGGVGVGTTIALVDGVTSADSGVRPDLDRAEAVASDASLLERVRATSGQVLQEAVAAS